MITNVARTGVATSADRDGARAIARLGDGHARLLAGPASPAAERLADHLGRLGPIEEWCVSGDDLHAAIHDAGIVGRGGGEYPLIQKLELARRSPGRPLVVVNASEGEPASRKDATLVTLRPHLVLDGAQAVAAAAGAPDVVVYVHEGRAAVAGALGAAIAERAAHAGDGPRVHVVEAPDRYVAGEASAVVSFLDHGVARPRRSLVPAAASGVGGRPTIVSNAETYAHAALAVRFGAAWFRGAGSALTPGSTLVTLAGSVPSPGSVLELVGPASVGDVLGVGAARATPPHAILLGGYAGTWIHGEVAWRTTLERHALRRGGAPLGCGLLAVLDDGCGIAETARLLGWMAGQSAGQCGPCVVGLPEIARLARALAEGRGTRSDVTRLRRLAASVRGRGGCGHPTWVAMLLESALDVFAPEVRHHVRGHSCVARGVGLPLRGATGPAP
jgi:NADH:ubiquinone oxidoreductase subunit F (NADH-binding)